MPLATGIHAHLPAALTTHNRHLVTGAALITRAGKGTPRDLVQHDRAGGADTVRVQRSPSSSFGKAAVAATGQSSTSQSLKNAAQTLRMRRRSLG